MKILTDKEFKIDEFFDYLDFLDKNEFDICGMYRIIIENLIDNIEYESDFKFKLPLGDQDIFVILKKKKNILKVMDYIIKHLYTFELYECIKDFMEIKNYYQNEKTNKLQNN